MAKRTINSAGVEIRERDLSLRVSTAAGTNVYITGYADQGPLDEVVSVTSLSEFEQIYGKPTTPAERYFYYTVKAAFNSTASILVNRLPYGNGSGQGFGSYYSALAYPVTAANSATLNISSGTYLVGKPYHFSLTQTQYQSIVDGTLFSQGWSLTGKTSLTALQDLSGAGIIVLNKAQTIIDGQFNGYYIGFSDNTNINPATNFDAIRKVETVTSTTSGTSTYTSIPTSRFMFALTATPEFGSNPAVNSVSQIMESKITNYDISTRYFDDTLNVGLFKLRQSVFSNNALQLDYLLEEGYNGSVGAYRQINSESGGAPRNFFLETIENESRNIQIIVNPYISDLYSGIKLNTDGTPAKKVRVISKQLVDTLTLSGYTLSGSLGVTLAQVQSAADVLGYGDSLFPVGAYGDTALTLKSVGDLPGKITRALDRIKNDEVFDIDVIAEGGLGTIWTTVCATSASYFDDTLSNSIIDALRTSNDLTDTRARDYYNTIANQFVTFAGPIKDGGRGDLIFVADPIRQILVSGKTQKILDDSTKNFSLDVYWALRHQFENINSSYATVFANYMKVYDSFSGLYIYVPPSGFVAAKMASTDSDVGPWGAPAGINRGVLNDVLDVAIAPNQRQRDELYKVNLNPITRFPSEGIVLYGQKTSLKQPSAFDRINVRRAFLYLEKVTKRVMKNFVFENNTTFTRTRVTNTLVPFFERVKANDGLVDYLIVCDERNNTPQVIDENELVVDIYIKPARTAEYILVNFYATRTDANFQELIGG